MISAAILAMMLQVPAQDTVVVRVPLPQAETVRDTTVVNVDVNMETDSLASVIARVQADVNAAIEAAGCNCGGPPQWFYAGVLTLGSLFLYKYWSNSDRDDDAEIMGDDMEPQVYEVPEPEDPCDSGHHNRRGGGG